MTITFATFHIEKVAKKTKAINPLNQSLRERYHILIDLMFRSAKVFHPSCRRVMLSDRESNFDYLNPENEESGIEIFRNQLEPNAPMMYSRLASQINYVKAHGASTDLVTLDSDILINGNVEDVFKEDFDVALTYRSREDMPINWGVSFISHRRPEKVIGFLEKVLEVYKAEYFTNSDFWCDQYALMDVVGEERFFNRQSNWLEIEGAKIRLLPCEVYNYSPEDEAKSVIRPFSREKLLHFKGNRKRFIETYWNAYLAHLETPRRTATYSGLRSRMHLLRAAFLEVGREQKRNIVSTLKGSRESVS